MHAGCRPAEAFWRSIVACAALKAQRSAAMTGGAPPNGPAAAKLKTQADQDKKDFLKVYEQLRDEIVNDDLLGAQPESSKKWMREMLDYNVPLGKLNRGLAVLDAVRAVRGRPLTPEETFEASVVGWGIEFLQAYFLVADDIMDHSVTRRGQPCWYRQPHVGMVAINDGILLEAAIYRLLSKHLGGHKEYRRLLDLFHDVTYRTAHGQLLDTVLAASDKVDLGQYTLDLYLRIVTYKTAYYTFYLPVATGLALAGVDDEKAYALAEDVCVQMGRYFQIQDDLLDCFGDPEVIGKVGTDIEDNKCSWLVVQALERASPEQRTLLEANYGKSEPAAVQAVKDLYRSLDLEAAFAAYEAESHAALTRRVDEQSLLPQEVFLSMLKKIYKRQK